MVRGFDEALYSVNPVGPAAALEAIADLYILAGSEVHATS